MTDKHVNAVRERPILFSKPMVLALLAGTKTQTRRTLKPHLQDEFDNPNCTEALALCPYGAPGERLYVKEVWQPEGVAGHERDFPIRYRATQDERVMGHRWRSPIFMPRWASRITLEIESVRVERLQDISEEDAWAEGIERTGFTEQEWQRHLDGDSSVLVACIMRKEGFWENFPTARHAYARLWDEINGLGSWALNPWVWALTLRRLNPDPAKQ